MGQENAAGQDRLQLLGAWRLLRGGASICPGMRQQRLIAAVAIVGPCTRSYLAGLLWPDATENHAKSSLRVGIHLASTQIPGLLVCDGGVLSLSETVAVDLHHVRDLLELAGRAHLDGMAASYVAELQTADLLPGWYDDFIVDEQNRLRSGRLHCFKRIAHDSLMHGQNDVAILASRAALAIEPYDDFSIAHLIRAETRQGNHTGAARIYDEYAATLRDNLGIPPPPAITALVPRRRAPDGGGSPDS